MSIKEYCLSLLEPITDGTTVRGDCPICGGQDTFTATVSGDSVLHNCYRGFNCDTKITVGRFYLRLSPEERLNYLKGKRKGGDNPLRAFIKPSYWVDGIGNDMCLRYMQEKHMVQAYQDGLFRPMYDPAERRFVFPIRNEANEVIGGVGRSLLGLYPKVLNYNDTYVQPFICGRGRKFAMLVEDCASAVAATRAPDITGIAMLGTHLREEYIPYLSPYEWVGIALDPDAYKKSPRLKEKLSPYIKDVRILRLANDIKDMDTETYLKFIYSL